MPDMPIPSAATRDTRSDDGEWDPFLTDVEEAGPEFEVNAQTWSEFEAEEAFQCHVDSVNAAAERAEWERVEQERVEQEEKEAKGAKKRKTKGKAAKKVKKGAAKKPKA